MMQFRDKVTTGC